MGKDQLLKVVVAYIAYLVIHEITHIKNTHEITILLQKDKGKTKNKESTDKVHLQACNVSSNTNKIIFEIYHRC